MDRVRMQPALSSDSSRGIVDSSWWDRGHLLLLPFSNLGTQLGYTCSRAGLATSPWTELHLDQGHQGDGGTPSARKPIKPQHTLQPNGVSEVTTVMRCDRQKSAVVLWGGRGGKKYESPTQSPNDGGQRMRPSNLCMQPCFSLVPVVRIPVSLLCSTCLPLSRLGPTRPSRSPGKGILASAEQKF